MTTGSEADFPMRTPPAGPVRGRREGEVVAFRGIPYGEAPVGARRFRPPVARAPWAHVRDCVDDLPQVPQPWDVLDERLDVPRLPWAEEDALQLTLRVPAGAEPGDRLPVMVWIHGGSLTTGSCTWPIYDGSAFARDGVVFVGVNYRMHGLGFLDLSGLIGEPDSVNLGLRDVVLGLEWVQRNIAAFGGDPDAVTIFGESAGGTLVGALTARPDARRLFRRAILQSGANFQLLQPDETRRIAENFLGLVGVPAERAALEALPIDRIVEVSQDPRLLEGVPRLSVPWNIALDPAQNPRSGYDVARSGESAGVELMLGWTLDESRLMWLAEDPPYEDLPVDSVDEATGRLLHERYARTRPELDGPERGMAISTDQYYMIPAVRIAAEHAAHGGRAYLYEFRWPSPVLDGRLGACHAMEVPFVFDQWASPSFTGTERPEQLIALMHTAWLTFARTGDPGRAVPPGAAAWAPYSAEDRRVMVFDLDSRVETDPRREERIAWDDVPMEAVGIL